jgi:DNA-directed RNA polymerase specialized sigma24 family protein
MTDSPAPGTSRPCGRAGDEEFRDFVARYASDLLNAAYVLLRDRDAAEDATQAALLRTFKRWSRARAAPEAFSQRVLINVCRNYWRHQHRHPTRDLADPDLAWLSSSAGSKVVLLSLAARLPRRQIPLRTQLRRSIDYDTILPPYSDAETTEGI